MWFKTRHVMSVALFVVAAAAAGCAKGKGQQGSAISDAGEETTLIEEGGDQNGLTGEVELTESLLPGDVSQLRYLFLEAAVVELKPATRHRPAREVPVRLGSNQDFPTLLELTHHESWAFQSGETQDPSVFLWVSGSHVAGYRGGFQIRGLRPSDENELVLTSQAMGYMSCGDWGVRNSDTDTFRSGIEDEVPAPDSAKIVLSENGDTAVVSFECQVRNQTRRYTLTYTRLEE